MLRPRQFTSRATLHPFTAWLAYAVDDPKPVSAYNLWNNIEKHDSVNYKAGKSKSVSLDFIIHDSNRLSHTPLQKMENMGE